MKTIFHPAFIFDFIKLIGFSLTFGMADIDYGQLCSDGNTLLALEYESMNRGSLPDRIIEFMSET